jgi:hypothetical protein
MPYRPYRRRSRHGVYRDSKWYSDARLYGRRYERLAKKKLAHMMLSVIDNGKWRTVDGVRGRPDGVVVNDGALVEVKCPYTLVTNKKPLQEYYAKRDNGLLKNGSLNVSNNEDAKQYWDQCQKYLTLFPEAPFLYFGVWCPADMMVIKIYRQTDPATPQKDDGEAEAPHQEEVGRLGPGDHQAEETHQEENQD